MLAASHTLITDTRYPIPDPYSGGGVVVLSPLFNLGGSCFCAGFTSVPSGLVVDSSGVGWRRLSVGRPGAPSSAPGSAPAVDALALESRKSLAFTRWNSEVLITYSSRSEKREASANADARRPAGAGWVENAFAIKPGFFLFLDSSFSNIVDIAVGS